MRQKLLIIIIFTSFIYTALFSQQQEHYRLKPNDEIEIFILGQPDLSKRFVVRPYGRITFPLIGELYVEVKPIAEVTTELKNKLSVFLPINEVSINLASGDVTRIYIFGEVKNPDEYTFPRDEKVSLVKLLAKAGGPNSSANLKNIEVKNASNKVTKEQQT